MALSGAEQSAPRVAYRGAVFDFILPTPMTGYPQGVIVKSPEEYRAMAAESLREAEALPERLRLNHIVVAQLWLELADKVTQLRLEIAAIDTPISGQYSLKN